MPDSVTLRNWYHQALATAWHPRHMAHMSRSSYPVPRRAGNYPVPRYTGSYPVPRHAGSPMRKSGEQMQSLLDCEQCTRDVNRLKLQQERGPFSFEAAVWGFVFPRVVPFRRNVKQCHHSFIMHTTSTTQVPWTINKGMFSFVAQAMIGPLRSRFASREP